MIPIKFTYKSIEDKCASICKKINKSKYKVDYIVGVSVGGLFPAIHFARLLNTKNLVSISVCSYDGKTRKEIKVVNLPDKKLFKDKNVLIVDDILDSGATIKYITKLFKEEYFAKEVKCATIFVNKKNCMFYPDYYQEEVGKWVAFPWDRFEK
ncbi:MAG: phosphoribosyltransferase family protein [archaeon]